LSLWLGDAIEHNDYEERMDELVAAWRGTRARVTAVSNEVGSGVVPDTASGRLFRDQLGRLNARIAAESDEVLLIVAGRVLQL
jgi:adenosylcobinamide kinase/adenosylcobinamide-phosphate guanylyltransferase